jgi:hypothetical protein
MAETGEDFDAILLELLPGAAAVALLASCEIAVDCVAVELEPGWQAAEDPDQSRAVRLARCCQPKGHDAKPRALVVVLTRLDRSFQTDPGQSPAS